MENNIFIFIESHPVAIILSIVLFFSFIYFLRLIAKIISEIILLIIDFFQNTWFFYDKRQAIKDFFEQRHAQKIRSQNRRRYNASKTKR